MEFWGVECKSGSPVKVEPGSDMIVHISQAALGESEKKVKEPIYVYLAVDGVKYTIGTLSHDKCPQLSAEILLEKGFELSHSWKHGSVYFTGYKVDAGDDEVDDSTDDELPVGSDKEISKPNAEEVKPEVKKTDAVKSETKQVNLKVPSKDAKAAQDDDDSDEDSEDDVSSSEGSSDDEEKKVSGGGDNDEASEDEEDSGEEEDDDSDEDETSDDETPKKPEQSKKRPAEAATPKTATSDKKVKFATPQKTEAKKPHVHVATPYPSKQTGKKPGTGEGSKQQTPKSGGSHSCKSCNRSFTSEAGLQSHTKAKHGAAA